VSAASDVVVPPVSELELDRRRYRQRQARRSTASAAVSTVVVAAVLVVAVTQTPGWPRVQQAFFDTDIGRKSFRPIVDALWLNVRIVVVAYICIIVVALVVASARTLRGAVFFPVRALATVYVDLIRGFPLIILLYLIGFGVPGLRISWMPKNTTILGCVVLVISYGANVAEVFRSGILSVHPSQRTASASLGLTYVQTMRLVVMPQAVRRVVPALLNDFVSLQKDVGLISILGSIDAVREGQILQAQYFNFTPYVVAGLLFVIIALPFMLLGDSATSRTIKREQAGSLV
jgi:polar amino acid transport system permease protein